MEFLFVFFGLASVGCSRVVYDDEPLSTREEPDLFESLFYNGEGTIFSEDSDLWGLSNDQALTRRLGAEATAPVLESDRANKLLRMRFYIWNKQMPFQPKSTTKVTVKAGTWEKSRLTYGAEVIDPLANMTSKIFDPSLKTQFMIHGFAAHVPLGGASLIMLAHEKRGDFDDYNFIALDWRDLAGWQFPGDGYGAAAHNTQYAGIRAAKMLLKMLGANSTEALANVHVIGHSLGCHVAGNMGRTITSESGQNLTHITAMEPAGPKFVDGNCEDIRLRKTDAEYIDAIHTDGALNTPFVERGRLGDLRDSMAMSNFYFNGGAKQPGCPWVYLGMVCNHLRSFHYYAESVYNPTAFKGYRCSLEPETRTYWDRREKKHVSYIDWRKLSEKGCLYDPPRIEDVSVTAYLTDEYGDDKPMGNFGVQTVAKFPYSDMMWNMQNPQ